MRETQIALAIIPAGLDAHGGRLYWLERRPSGVDFGGMLAFPGGKILAGETPPQGLVREIKEELGLNVTQATLLIEIPWVYLNDVPAKSKHLRFWVYRVDAWDGPKGNLMHGLEGQTLQLVLIEGSQARALMAQLPAANRGMIAALCLPPRMVITPPCELGSTGFDAWLARLQHTAETLNRRFKQAALIQLRPQRQLSLPEWQRAVAVVQAEQVMAWVNADLATAWACAADGVHLNRERLFTVEPEAVLAWQNQNRWVSAAGHNVQEIERAHQLGVDAVLISPVLPTLSHPNASGIGWAGFAALARLATMPAYALGGMSEACLAEAQAQGAQGIAGIRGFGLPD